MSKYWARTKARIPHRCQKCGAEIPKGEFYYKEKVDFVHPLGLAFGELCLKCGEEKSSTMTQPTMCNIEGASTGIKVIFGDAQKMEELPDRSVQLVVTSPPYFNAPFDYPNLFEGYTQFLQVMRNVAKELKRVNNLYLAEGKHARGASLPSLGDRKDGLVKMILFTNLEDVRIEGHTYNPIAVLKLTTGSGFSESRLNDNDAKLMGMLRQETDANQFKFTLNNKFVVRG